MRSTRLVEWPVQLVLGVLLLGCGTGRTDIDAAAGMQDAATGGYDGGSHDGDSTSHRRAVVAATDYATPGQLFQIDLETRAVTAVGNTGEDPVLRRFEDKILLINRFGAINADNVQPLDSTTFIGPQFSTGRGSNPHDVACVSLAKCYVAAYGYGTIPILNLETGERTGAVDIAHLDPDGVPNTEALFIVGETLFATIQRLTPSFVPRGVGQVVVIDVTRDTIIDVIDLASANPLGWFRPRPLTTEICVVTAGNFSGTQGGIECIDTATRVPTGFVVRSQSLGGYIGGFAFAPDGTRGWAAVNGRFPNSELWELDVAAGTPIRRIGTSTWVTDVALNDRGELYVADRTPGSSGIRIYRADTAEEVAQRLVLRMLPPAFTDAMLFLP